MHKLKIGILGCGAIGSSLAKAIVRDFPSKAKIYGLYDLHKDKAGQLSIKLSGKKDLVAVSLQALVSGADLIVEAASAKVSWEVARSALSAGKDIMIMSVGGVLNRLRELSELAKTKKAKVYIPSGAISGIDALKAAKLGKLRKVILTTTKHPLSFKGVKYIEQKGINLNKIKRDTVLFSGKASSAVKLFPQNINVAAVLSLAGIGENKTQVKIIASPKVTKNIHEIRIESAAGNIYTRTENILHPDNPKTSYLAVLAAIATLKQILEPIRIGT